MAKRYKNIPVTINYDDQTLASTHSSTQIPSGNIAISDNGLNFMLAFDRYRGHQYWNGEKYVMGYNYSGKAFPNGITETNAYRLWLADITKAQNSLRKQLNNNPSFFLQHQWDALVSFYYNTGSINYTEIEGYEFDFLYFLQNGTKDDIASLLQTDNRAPTRRTAEASLFRLGNYGNIKPRVWLRNEGIQYIRQNYFKLEDKDGNINKKAQQQAQYSYYLETGKFIKEISEIDRRRIIALIEQDADTSIDTSTPIEQYIVKTTTDAEYSAISTTDTATTTPALTVIDYSASAVGATATTATTTTATTTTTAGFVSHTHDILDWLPTGGLAGQFLSITGEWADIPTSSTNTNTTYSLSSETISNSSVNLRLRDSNFVDNNITIAGGGTTTITETGSTITITSSGGSGSALEIEDEESSLSNAVTKINFAGTGVTATESSADQILVTIPGGITLTDLSVIAKAAAAGNGGIAYNNSNGEFQYTPPDVDHNSLTNFVANEHIDWTSDQSATDIHSGNYTNTTYDLFTTSAAGLAPTLPTSPGGKFLTGAGTWAVPVDTNTTYDLFTTSAAGLAPTLPTSPGGEFLKGDGAWEVPPDTNTTYDLFTTSAAGLAPTLPTSPGGKFLTGAGTWAVPVDTDTTYDLFTTSAAGLAPTLPTSPGGKFLTGAGTWAVPVDTDTTYSNFTGDAGSGGIAGLVPAPAAGDTSANKFLKANATWETLDSFSAVTDGALSDGEIVVQQLDGTVKAIGVLGTDYSTDMFERGIGSSAAYVFDNSTGNVSASYAEEISRFLAFDPNQPNKFVVVYTDADNSNYGTAKVGTVSGTTITYSAAVVFASADTLVQAIVFDPHIATKFLVVYTDKSYAGNTNAGTIKVGTLVGTSITFGSAVTFNHDSVGWPQNSRHISIAFDPSNHAEPDSRFIVAYGDGAAGSNVTDSGVCQLGYTNYSSGPPDVSLGWQYIFSHDGYQTYPNVEFTSIAFDPHIDYRFIIAYMEDQSGAGGGDNASVVVGKINDWQYTSTVLDFGEPNFEVARGPNNNYCVHIGNVAFDPFIANKYLLIYVRQGGGQADEYQAGATIGTIDDDTSTVGSEYLFFTSTSNLYIPERCTGAFDPFNANKFVVASNIGLAPPYVPAGPLERQGVVVGTISGTTITYSTQSEADDITTPNVSHMTVTFDPNTRGNFVYAYRNDTDKGTVIVGSLGESNLNNENFIGISNGAYADGATATIQISGSVDDAQTGLTPGSRYYVQADGAISTTPDTGTSVHVGIALSATDLLQLNLPNKFDGILELDGQIKITGGSPGANKVLTSDAIGLASWELPVARSFTGGTTTGIAVGSSEKIRVLANGYTGFGGETTPTHPIHHSSGAHLTTAGAWSDASDIMRKSSFEPLNYGLPEVLQLIPKRYKLIDGSFDIGFIAQEIENIIPEVVSGIDAYTNNEGALVGGKGIAYGHIAAVLVKAVQQLSDKNSELEEKIKRLEEWQMQRKD